MHLKVAFLHNPRIEPLLDRHTEIPGAETTWELGDPNTLHLRHLRENCYDLFEFSLAAYLTVRDRPAWSELRWIALPIFLNKAYLLVDLYVHERAGIHSLADLRGKRIGVPEFGMTAGVWFRILLRELHQIEAHDVTWIIGRPPERRQGMIVGELPVPGVTIRDAPAGHTLNDLLHSGAVDAAFGDFDVARIEDGPAVRRFFTPESAQQMFADFYRLTGAMPVNHTVILQERCAEADPTLPRRAFDAFERAKLQSYERARRAASAYLMFPSLAFSAQQAVFGEDPYPSGITANHAMLELLGRQLQTEGQLSQVPRVEELFHESLLGT